jgi:Holliday junction resolvasome RuvABC endonuclease subunit
VRVAGIDSAVGVCGWAVVERQPGAREHVVATGVFRNVRAPADVLNAAEALAAHAPDVVALEAPYVGKNPDSALVLAELLGAFRQELGRRGLHTTSVQASVWQMGILGGGRGGGLICPSSPRAARKAAAQLWARAAFRLEGPLTTDECDALGLAVWVLRTRSLPTPLSLPFPPAPRRRRRAA